jgi:2'-5' RNA ligase
MTPEAETDPPLVTFLALRAPADVRERLRRIAEEIPTGGGRPVSPRDFHLTLLYLGSLGASERRAVVQALEGFRFPALRLVLDRLGSFHDGRVLWAGPRVVPPALVLLARTLASLGLPSAAGDTTKSRPFQPHVTLVRGARTRQDDVFDPPLVWTARHFVLAVRLPRADGVYRLLARWRLGGAGPRPGGG